MSRPQDSPEVLERFHASLDLVQRVVTQISLRIEHRMDRNELLSFGQEGLLDAARRYDPSRGVPFTGYAVYRVRGAIMDGIRSRCRLPRRLHDRLRALEAASRVSEGMVEDLLSTPAPECSAAEAELALVQQLGATAMAMALGSSALPVEDTVADSSRSPESDVARTEALARVGEALISLEPVEAELIRRHYFDGEQFEHVAQELGISPSWASRLHKRAVSRLADWFSGALEP